MCRLQPPLLLLPAGSPPGDICSSSRFAVLASSCSAPPATTIDCQLVLLPLLLPLLLLLLLPLPALQAHASAAVVNFSESCESDTMGPHLDALITKLLTLLQQGKKVVQEGALTALASVADCSQEQFVRYYGAVMPLLSQILFNAQNKEHRQGGVGGGQGGGKEGWGVGGQPGGGKGALRCAV
jgi:hypothetical protein